ncbi:MAG TPA: ABC transporter ATP-binding protein [Candidatus Bathyarchaeia archaeon]|nr:ABC transporter ATP-binding protein [Candidatus Bathyarchaeia archaeon]
MNSGVAIEMHNLTKTFKSRDRYLEARSSFFARREREIVTAVDHLNLEIKSGELFGLLGPNGAGKTTLVKMLCTLLPPDEGSAVVSGFDVARQPMDVRRSIGALFSVGERGAFWRLSGYKNLEFFSAIYNVPRSRRHERIMEVLDLVGLKDKAFDRYQRFSGGMKRKLALARVLLPDTPILLLDEPTVGLDVISSRTLREFIKNDLSRKAGKTVFYTTHYVEEASQICDRIGILNRGRLVACDTPSAIRGIVKKGEVVEIRVQSITDPQIGAMKTMGGVVDLVSEVEDSVLGQRLLRLHLESIDLLPMVLDFVFKEKIRLIDLKREEPTLEDAFIELTGRGIGK